MKCYGWVMVSKKTGKYEQLLNILRIISAHMIYFALDFPRIGFTKTI